MKTINFLGLQMHTGSMNETVDSINQRISAHQFTQHVVINVAKTVNIRKNDTLKASIEACDIINIDGMGVVLGARLLGHKISERVAGVDLFGELLSLSAREGYPVFFLGSEDDVVTKTANKCKDKYPKLIIAGYHHGYFWDNEEAVVENIRNSGARLLFVAITSPKKENFINKWKGKLGVDFVMGVGGTFDVISGKVKRAPLWMQKYALEWLYRVIQEPRRMWKRYLITNSIFVWLLLKEKTKMLLKLKDTTND